MSQQYTEVELGGKTRLLRYDYNAVCEIEEQFGKGISAIFANDQAGFRSVRIILWAGLRWKDPGITLQRVGQMLNEEVKNGTSLEEIFKIAFKALNKSGVFGKKADVDDTDEDEPEEAGNE